MSDTQQPINEKIKHTLNRIWKIYRSGTSNKNVFYTVIIIYFLNILILIYTLLSILFKMSIAGNTVIELIPIILWVLPLFFLIPLITLALFKSKNTIGPLLVMLIASLLLLAISPLLSKMAYLNFINLIGVILIFGGFHFPKIKHVKRPKISKSGIFWFVFLNVIGFGFPYTVSYMGQNPIVSLQQSSQMPKIGFIVEYNPTIGASIKIDNFSNDTLNLIAQNGYIVLDSLADQYTNNSWLYNTTKFLIEHNINIVAKLRPLSNSDSHVSMSSIINFYNTTQEFIQWVKENNFQNHISGIELDFSQARNENLKMMKYMRRVDIPGLCNYLRQTGNISATNTLQVYEQLGSLIHEQGFNAISLGMPMVLDDFTDEDNFIQLLMGHPMGLQNWDIKGISLERSTISYAMEGEVYSYYTYTYGLSAYRYFGNKTVVSIGVIGNISENALNITHTSYSKLPEIVKDITILSRLGIPQVELYSLNTLIESFGESAIAEIFNGLHSTQPIEITYTFRIHAFRMVFMAIDSYDWLI